MSSTYQGIEQVLRFELEQLIEKRKLELMKEFTQRFQAEMFEVATQFTLGLDRFYSVERLEDDVRITLRVKPNE